MFDGAGRQPANDGKERRCAVTPPFGVSVPDQFGTRACVERSQFGANVRHLCMQCTAPQRMDQPHGSPVRFSEGDSSCMG